MEVRIILVPYDSGHHRKRMGLGPERVFEAGLKPLFARRAIRFECEEIALESEHPAEIRAAFQLCRKVADRVRASRARGEFPIVLSGNCGTAVGTVSGCGAESTGIAWFDAHGEAMTPETTSSGFLDGMPIGTLLGRAWQTLARSVPGFVAVPGKRILLIGAHDLEPSEIALLDDAGVRRVATVEQVGTVLSSLKREVGQLYLHVDLDVLDSAAATANPWATPGGLGIDSLLNGVAEIRQRANVVALGIASYDPATDRNGKALATAVSAVEMLLFGD